MALVNPNIAMSFRQPEFTPRNALAEYAQIQQIQSGQRQNEVADMPMEALRRDRDALSQIQAAIVAKGGPPDLAAAADAMIKSGKPEYLTQGMAIRQKLADQAAFATYQSEFGPKAPGAAPTGMPAAAPAPGSFAADVEQRRAAMPVNAFAAAPVNALAPTPAPAAPVNAMVGKPDVTALEARYRRVANIDTPGAKAEAALLLKQIDAASKESRLYTVPGVGLVDPTGRVITSSVEKPAAPPTMVAEYTFAKTPEGGNFQGTYQQFVTARAAAGRAPAQPAQPSAPVAVVDPATGKQVFVSREEALRNRMTPAAAMESLSPKEIQKREAAYPQATSSVNGFESNSDLFIQELIKLRDDPGLNQITGPIYGRTPSVSREGSRAQALYNKIFAKGGFQALQDMRDASKTGGALGNVSNAEGERLERSVVGGLDRTQNAADVKQGINDLIDQIEGSKVRMREAYDMTYGYKANASAATPRQLTPQDRDALNWANSNPGDPRAAQIKQRLGAK